MSSDDIVEITLNGRKYGRLTTGDWAGPFPYMTAELEHALDEIERLREQVEYRDDVIAMLRADVARLGSFLHPIGEEARRD